MSSRVKTSVLMTELACDIIAIYFLSQVMYYWRELGSGLSEEREESLFEA